MSIMVVQKRDFFLFWSSVCHGIFPRRRIEAKNRFLSITEILSFVSKLYNGFLEYINQKLTRITWFNEYIFFFEMTWGRTITRWEDVERIYKVRHPEKIFDIKLIILLNYWEIWTEFLSFGEDLCLWKRKLERKIWGHAGIIMGYEWNWFQL